MKTETDARDARRIERQREERTCLHAIAVAAERLVDNVPGATFATLECTVRAWREWRSRRRSGAA